jgi:hypothetical protein
VQALSEVLSQSNHTWDMHAACTYLLWQEAGEEIGRLLGADLLEHDLWGHWYSTFGGHQGRGGVVNHEATWALLLLFTLVHAHQCQDQDHASHAIQPLQLGSTGAAKALCEIVLLQGITEHHSPSMASFALSSALSMGMLMGMKI